MSYDNTNKGAIWIKTARSWLKYKSGTLNVEGKDFKITMFDNQYKNSENQPDFNIVIEPMGNQVQQTDITKWNWKSWKDKERDRWMEDEISVEDIPF